MENPLIRAELTKPGGIAARLTEARTRANLSGKDLAHRTGLITSKISKLAGGQQLPTAADVHTRMTAALPRYSVSPTREFFADMKSLLGQDAVGTVNR